MMIRNALRRAACVAAGLAVMIGVIAVDAASNTTTESSAPVDIMQPADAATLADIDAQRYCLAAGLVLARITTGGRIEEDWTWHDAPYVVGEQNDALVTAMRDAGYGYDDADVLEWLARTVGQCIADDAAREGLDTFVGNVGNEEAMETVDGATGDAMAVVTVAHRRITEDSPGFRCARHGNRVCGPRNREGARPGCYHNGRLVISWTRYDLDRYGNPSRDPLWGQLTPPC